MHAGVHSILKEIQNSESTNAWLFNLQIPIFKKDWAIHGIFVYLLSSSKNLSLTGFKLRISGVKSDRSANCATTTARLFIKCIEFVKSKRVYVNLYQREKKKFFCIFAKNGFVCNDPFVSQEYFWNLNFLRKRFFLLPVAEIFATCWCYPYRIWILKSSQTYYGSLFCLLKSRTHTKGYATDFWYLELPNCLFRRYIFLKKMGQPRPLFRLFSVFSNRHRYNFYISMWKNVMSIQYTAQGFKPMNFGTWAFSHNH